MPLVTYLKPVIYLINLIFTTLWLLLPSYTPNNFAVIFGGGKPIDMGKKFVDGRRILGDGKTFRGFISGFFGGILTAHIELLLEKIFNFRIFSILPYFSFLYIVVLLSIGSIIGDCIGSFIKRRFKVERGDKFPLLDQYDFLAFSLAFASLNSCFWKLFSVKVIIVGLIITPILHRLTNILAYKLGLKDVPW